jgi:hypothetical protein
MDWVIAVPRDEAPGAKLTAETAAAARAAFIEHGCVLLRGMFQPAPIEAMHREYLAQFGTLDMAAMGTEVQRPAPNRFLAVGSARCDITLRMTGAFGNPDVFANPRLLELLGPLLGPDIHLSNFTAVVSHPGAALQHIHRDLSHLFPDTTVGPDLPVYAVNCAVPLIDVDVRTGPTGVWLGSHRWAEGVKPDISNVAVAPLQRGDCMMLDYRTLHTGLPNAGRQVRPIVYMVYARPWFFDNSNHISRIPLDMPIEHYNRMPEHLRPLLTRAFSYQARARWLDVDARAPAAPPGTNAPAIPGRNDPCPCGSGQKFKHCHGRLG